MRIINSLETGNYCDIIYTVMSSIPTNDKKIYFLEDLKEMYSLHNSEVCNKKIDYTLFRSSSQKG